MMKRLAAVTLALCLFLMPVGALADSQGVRFHLSAEINAEAYPESVRPVMAGLSDLMEALTIDGELVTLDDLFDLSATLVLSDRARAGLHAFGGERFWYVRSPLVGNETLCIDLIQLAEFAIKTYFYFEIPLQRFAILLPYVHSSGLKVITDAARPVLFGSDKSRTISRKSLSALAQTIAEAVQTDRTFRYWALALGQETGFSDDITGALTSLPEWVNGFVPSSGLKVTVKNGVETWAAGSLTLARLETDVSGAQTLSLTLPPLPDGMTIALEAASQPDGELIHFGFDLLIARTDETLLNLHADGSLPTALPVDRAFSLTWDAEGSAVDGDGVHLCFEGEPDAQGLTLRQMTPDRADVMLTLAAALSPFETDLVPEARAESVDLFSITTPRLNDLMSRIISPLVHGALPLIAEAPASFCQAMMNLMEDTGILSTLTEGFDE